MLRTTRYANSVFEQPWWLDLVAPGQWGECIVKNHNDIVARLPYVKKRNSIIMPPFTQTLGPWMIEEYRQFCQGNTQLSKQKECITALLEQLPSHKRFCMTFDSSNEYILPYRWLGYRYIPSFSYRLCDLSDLEQVYANFNKTAKKNIKYARNKVEMTSDLEIQKFVALLEKTFAVQNRCFPYATESVQKIMDFCIQNNHGKLFIAQDDDQNVHAGAFLLYDEKICYYLFGGSDPEYRSSGAQSLVLWEAIRFASEKSRSFDFEGSNIEGIEHFFRQFGGKRVINYMVSRQSFLADCIALAKPRVKRLIRYKI